MAIALPTLTVSAMVAAIVFASEVCVEGPGGFERLAELQGFSWSSLSSVLPEEEDLVPKLIGIGLAFCDLAFRDRLAVPSR